MRRQIDGLASPAQDVTQQDLTCGALFAFINARSNKWKLLLPERNGSILWYDPLEREKFHWPRQCTDTVITLSVEQLKLLREGYDVWRMKPPEALHFSVLSQIFCGYVRYNDAA
jgi:hypothetical protein